MGRTIKIETRDYIVESEYPNIIKKVNDIYGVISNEDIKDAADVLIAAFANSHINGLYVNMDERERELAPVKEMTLEEIEKKHGYKVKIVNK